MPAKEIKEFDYKLILDIMDRALKFDKVKLEVKNQFTLELDTSTTVKTALVTAEAKVKEVQVKEKDLEAEQENNKKIEAINEIARHEELLLTDPDAYMEMEANQDKYFKDKYDTDTEE